jgi:hypothetical protein
MQVGDAGKLLLKGTKVSNLMVKSSPSEQLTALRGEKERKKEREREKTIIQQVQILIGKILALLTTLSRF